MDRFLGLSKDCSACRKQVQDLNCLKQPIFLVGAFSTESELRQEYRKLATKKPAFYGDREVLKRLDINEKLTPQIVLLKKGKSQKLLGLTDCKEIQKRVTQEGALG